MKQYENSVCSEINKLYRLKFEDANFAEGLIPQKILLDKTRNIHSYFVICRNFGNQLTSNYWNSRNFDNTIKPLLSLQYSDLDRPLFFIFYIKNDLMAIEGNQIREAVLDNPGINIYEFMMSNSDKFSEIVMKIYNEL